MDILPQIIGKALKERDIQRQEEEDTLRWVKEFNQKEQEKAILSNKRGYGTTVGGSGGYEYGEYGNFALITSISPLFRQYDEFDDESSYSALDTLSLSQQYDPWCYDNYGNEILS